MIRLKRRIIIQIIILNLLFMFTSLLTFRLVRGSLSNLIIIFLLFYAFLNGFFAYLIFWYNELKYKKDIFHFDLIDIPNQNYLKTLSTKYFKGNSFLLSSIIITNHEELIKVFDETFFYNALNVLFKNMKNNLKYKNIILSNNSRKLMIIVETKNVSEVLSTIAKTINKEIIIEEIPVRLEFKIGYSNKIQKINLKDRNIFLESDIAASYAVNHEMRVVNFDDIKHYYQYDYSLLKLIPTAIKKKELVVYYQPIIPIKKEELLYLEMLIRWKRDDKIIMPNDFIPYLEETPLINDFSLYLIKEAIRVVKKYLKEGYNIALSINISPKNLENSKFVFDAVNYIKESKLDRRHFEFEITEGSEIIFTPKILRNILKFEKLGVKIALDDFGSGFSNISYFGKMPINYIKIDKDITKNINLNDNSNKLIKNLIRLMQDLGYGIVFEGVETIEQMNFLIENNANYLQGFYISKPVSELEIEKWIEDNYSKYVDWSFYTKATGVVI